MKSLPAQVLEICDSDFKKLVRTPVHLTELHIITIFYNLLCGIKYLSKSGAPRGGGAWSFPMMAWKLEAMGSRANAVYKKLRTLLFSTHF